MTRVHSFECSLSRMTVTVTFKEKTDIRIECKKEEMFIVTTGLLFVIVGI